MPDDTNNYKKYYSCPVKFMKVEKMEIVTDYSEVVIETSDLIMKKAVFDDWEQLYRNITSRPKYAKYMLWKIDDSEEKTKDRMLQTLDFQSKEK